MSQDELRTYEVRLYAVRTDEIVVDTVDAEDEAEAVFIALCHCEDDEDETADPRWEDGAEVISVEELTGEGR